MKPGENDKKMYILVIDSEDREYYNDHTKLAELKGAGAIFELTEKELGQYRALFRKDRAWCRYAFHEIIVQNTPTYDELKSALALSIAADEAHKARIEAKKIEKQVAAAVARAAARRKRLENDAEAFDAVKRQIEAEVRAEIAAGIPPHIE